MEQNKEQKWYPNQHDEVWSIYDEKGKDQLWINAVGEEQAEKNAMLCASAPQWKEIVHINY